MTWQDSVTGFINVCVKLFGTRHLKPLTNKLVILLSPVVMKSIRLVYLWRGLRKDGTVSSGTHAECRPPFTKYSSFSSPDSCFERRWVSAWPWSQRRGTEEHKVVFLLQTLVWVVGDGEGSHRECESSQHQSGKLWGPHVSWCIPEYVHDMGESSMSQKQFHIDKLDISQLVWMRLLIGAPLKCRYARLTLHPGQLVWAGALKMDLWWVPYTYTDWGAEGESTLYVHISFSHWGICTKFPIVFSAHISTIIKTFELFSELRLISPDALCLFFDCLSFSFFLNYPRISLVNFRN